MTTTECPNCGQMRTEGIDCEGCTPFHSCDGCQTQGTLHTCGIATSFAAEADTYAGTAPKSGTIVKERDVTEDVDPTPKCA